MPLPPAPLRVQLTDARERIPLTREQWNALARRNATATVFQTWEWFDAWWSAFGADRELFFLSVHDGDDVVGFAPLMLIRGRFGLRQLELVSSWNADYQDLVIPGRRAEAISLLCSYLHDHRRRWDMIVLRNLPATSPTRTELAEGFRRIGLGGMDMERVACPALRIAGNQSEIRSLFDRYSVRRKLRQLESRGLVRFRVLRTEEEIARHLPAFFEQHMQRRQAAGMPSQFTDPRHREWFRRMSATMREAGWLQFSVVECGGKPVAYHFGYQFGNVLYWYKPSFDRNYARESPGTVLIQSLIQDAITEGLDELDYGGGEEPFKGRFSNDARTNVNLRFFARGSLRLAFVSGGRLRRTAARGWRAVRTLLR